MKRSHRPNDWKKVIDAQTIATFNQDVREKNLKKAITNLYKKQIDFQLTEKQQRAIEEEYKKENEALSMYKTCNEYENFKAMQHHEKKAEKYNLFSDYIGQLTHKESKKKFESLKDYEKDQEIIDQNAQAIEQARYLENQKKNERVNLENEFLWQKSLEKNWRSVQEIKEKELDKELIAESMERAQKCQREYALKMNDIEKKLDKNQKSYLKASQNASLRHMATSGLFEKWENDVKVKSRMQDYKEQKRKAHQKYLENNALQQQLQEKYFKQEMDKQNTQQEKIESDLAIHQFQKTEKQQKVDDFYQKMQLSNVLQTQMRDKEIEKVLVNTFSQREKDINREILEKNEEINFKGIPGVFRSQSSLESSCGKIKRIRDSENVSVCSGFDSPDIMKNKRMSYTRYENPSRTSDNRHNPITNPIGQSVPSGKSFLRGKGLITLT